MGERELTTDFMKLDLKKLHLTSSYRFLFKEKHKTIAGQAFYASATDYKLHLFNLTGGKSKTLDF